MAYQTGSASSAEDFMNILQTFAVANGWTLNIYNTTNDWMAMNNGSVFVQFRWDANGLIGIFHSLGFINTSTAPGNHTNDSGLGIVDASAPYNATLSTGATNCRVQFFPNGAITAYHLFTDGTTKYIYAVLETSPGVFYHMGMGTIDKIGTWTGGEFVYGDHGTDTSMPVSITSGPWQSASTSTTTNNTQLSLHIEGLPGQNANGKWGIGLTNNTTVGDNAAGNDRGGNPRQCAFGVTFNSGFNLAFSRHRFNATNGLVPLMPIEVYYKNTPVSGQHRHYLLGYAPDMYVMNMGAWAAGDEIAIGGDTFKIFPARQKGVSHGNMAFVYRKVV